ncbi:MAG: sulfotransferase [Sphingomonadales bacterium]
MTSHPAVEGAGEHEEMGHINAIFEHLVFEQLRGPDRKAGFGLAMKEQANNFARRYLESLPPAGPEVLRVTDKMPLNCLHLGLVALLFPKARVIHLRRDPMDTCLSMFCRAFPKAYSFAHDLADLVHFYKQYARLMDHWRAVLPMAFLDVDYEELVANQKAVSRRIVSFCGLDWNPACLNFHENKRAAFTFSELQVRQPIYANSVERWRRYERHLTGLRDAFQRSLRTPPTFRRISRRARPARGNRPRPDESKTYSTKPRVRLRSGRDARFP